jgi:AraC-like DNA-binding protein
MVNFVRAASLEGFADLAMNAGADPVRLCEAVGVPIAALRDRDARIRSDAMGALLDLAARQTGIDDFGLRLGSLRRPSSWGAAGLLMGQQRTVSDALQAGGRYIGGHSEETAVEIEAYGDETVVWIDISHDADAMRFDPSQRSEMVIAAAVSVLSRLTRRDWRPERVGFTHAAWGDLERYRPYFGRIPLFDQDRLHFALTRADLDITLPDYDPEAERLLRQMAEQQLPEKGRPFARAVALTIAKRLAEGALSADGVASALDLDLRTLQRRLAGEGSSFSEVLYDVRKELARTYVESSRRPLAEVADLLGFSSLSAFSQWYSRAHGQSAALRRAGRASLSPATRAGRRKA